jgi:ubiquinone/menaquinone biosynthesis C-methylase UbiE
VKARPGYPAELIPLLREKCGLHSTNVVADIGSGTGMLSLLLCGIAQAVYGVEPNQAMREAGEAYLAECQNFVSVNGAAENTTLLGTSVDLITVAQAFHWFNHDDARHEFLRVLKPNGWTALIWNDRKMQGSPVAEAYEQLLLDFGTDYAQVKQQGKSSLETLDRFFGHSQYKQATFKNVQRLDRDSFRERVISASYMPASGHLKYPAMLSAVDSVFDKHQDSGNVVLEYDTNVYYGQMS